MAQAKPKRKRRSARPRRKSKSKPAQRAIVKHEPKVLSIPEAIEQVLIAGDLTPLLPEQRIDYYRRVCRSLGLNPLTKPFDYILFKASENAPGGKLQLYANKDCAAQLRKIHNVSVMDLHTEVTADFATARIPLKDAHGKVDAAMGMVSLTGYSQSR